MLSWGEKNLENKQKKKKKQTNTRFSIYLPFAYLNFQLNNQN